MLAVTKVLLDDPLPPFEETVGPDRSTAKTISDVRRAHASHWKCFQSGKPLVASISHRTTTTQRKRKRKNSDTEYTPHQKAGSNQPAAPSVRRTSKRLVASAKLELSSWSTFTKRSSSSTSALTSASSSSFDRLPTPKDLDLSDDPTSTPKFESRESPPKESSTPESQWSEDETPFPWGSGTVRSMKIGFPSKEKKLVNTHNHSPSTSYGFMKLEVGNRIRLPSYL